MISGSHLWSDRHSRAPELLLPASAPAILCLLALLAALIQGGQASLARHAQPVPPPFRLAAWSGSLPPTPLHPLPSTTYYVNSLSGSDAATGTTPQTAWRSLARVDATQFQPGDRILFARGGTWYGQLHPLGSGAAGQPIVIAAYGAGPMPLINGGSLPSGPTSGAAVLLQNQSYWQIQGLQVENNSGLNNFGSLSVQGLPRYGILVENSLGSLVRGIAIGGNVVDDVNGCFNCAGQDAHMNGGIAVLGLAPSDSFQDVSIIGNSVAHVGRTGIVFWDSIDYPATIENQLSTQVDIAGNRVTYVDGDGILMYGTLDGFIQHNVVGHAGQRTISGFSEASSAGLWPTRSIGAVVQYNEVYGTLTQGTDGEGFDVDEFSVDTTVQYNYSHDNEGGFLLMEWEGSSGLVARYNLSLNDGWGGVKGVFDFAETVPEGTTIYNNTVVTEAGTHENIMHCDLCDGTDPGLWSFENNIIDNQGSGGYSYPGRAEALIAYNLFYGNHPSSEPSDPEGLTSNPDFSGPLTVPYGIDSVGAYSIKVSSPADASGVIVPDNGGRDYFGHSVCALQDPSRGFAEPEGKQGSCSLDVVPAQDHHSHSHRRSRLGCWGPAMRCGELPAATLDCWRAPDPSSRIDLEAAHAGGAAGCGELPVAPGAAG